MIQKLCNISGIQDKQLRVSGGHKKKETINTRPSILQLAERAARQFFQPDVTSIFGGSSSGHKNWRSLPSHPRWVFLMIFGSLNSSSVRRGVYLYVCMQYCNRLCYSHANKTCCWCSRGKSNRSHGKSEFQLYSLISGR